MGDLELLREWRKVLSNGQATVTVEFDKVRYTFPHVAVDLTFQADVAEDERDDASDVRTYRDLGSYSVSIDADAWYEGGDDAAIREVVNG